MESSALKACKTEEKIGFPGDGGWSGALKGNLYKETDTVACANKHMSRCGGACPKKLPSLSAITPKVYVVMLLLIIITTYFWLNVQRRHSLLKRNNGLVVVQIDGDRVASS